MFETDANTDFLSLLKTLLNYSPLFSITLNPSSRRFGSRNIRINYHCYNFFTYWIKNFNEHSRRYVWQPILARKRNNIWFKTCCHHYRFLVFSKCYLNRTLFFIFRFFDLMIGSFDSYASKFKSKRIDTHKHGQHGMSDCYF